MNPLRPYCRLAAKAGRGIGLFSPRLPARVLSLLVLACGIPCAALRAVWVAGSAGSSQQPTGPSTSLPPGTVLYLRLETPLTTTGSHLHGAVAARVVREVPSGEKVAVPLGSVIRGRIEKLIPSSNPADRAHILVQFTRLETPDHPPLKLGGHLKEVDNARESVLPDGTIQGLLASELPLAHLEAAIGKLGKGNGDVQKVGEKAFGKPDTTIEYPAGTDLEWVLDEPLRVDGSFQAAAPNVLREGVGAAASQLLANAPQRASGKDGKPGDPLNLVVIGNEVEIRKVFREAGWAEAAQQNSNSVWETIRAVIAERGYSAAPVSSLYLYGRPEDLAFEKMLNTFTKRHHLRLWRSPATTLEGREIWLGAATHDIGLDVRPGVISHTIDPDLDAERAKVGADLLATGRVAAETLVTRADPLSQGLTATGASWTTDGKLQAIELRSP